MNFKLYKILHVSKSKQDFDQHFWMCLGWHGTVPLGHKILLHILYTSSAVEPRLQVFGTFAGQISANVEGYVVALWHYVCC